MTADTMTDTTKPTGDTIDDEIVRLITAARSEGIARGMSDKFAADLAAGQVKMHARAISRRLAERPNRAVARGDETEDCVAINRSVLKLAEKVIKPLTIQATPGRNLLTESNARFVHEQIIAALTTPTETTDPAMERDDAE